MKVLALLTVTALLGCKDKAPAASDKPADRPADRPADKPAEPPVTWTTYTSKDANFTMEFPSPPKETAQGTTTMVTSEFGATSADSRTAGCGMATSPVPGKGATPKMMLDAMATGYKADAKVLEDKDITVGKYPGKSLIIENTRHRKWLRFYVIEGKLYINNCGGPFDRADKDAPTALRVLDSFKLTT